MPIVIKNIESIAIERGQDTLYISFPEIYKSEDLSKLEENKSRKDFYAFMDKELPHLKLEMSLYSDAETMGIPYFGDIAIHIDTDINNLDYVKILEKYEEENGEMKNPEKVVLYLISLEYAEKLKKERDEMWENE